MSARWCSALAVAGFALALTGCSDSTRVTVFKQGTYQGKPDTQPWQSRAFNSSQQDWRATIDARTAKQNEYPRIENQ
jgi:hypothetical protein